MTTLPDAPSTVTSTVKSLPSTTLSSTPITITGATNLEIVNDAISELPKYSSVSVILATTQ